MSFILFAAALTLLALLFLLLPLIRHRRRPGAAGIATLLLVPLLAGLLYLQLGHFGTAPAPRAGPDIEAMVAQLERRLTETPDNLEGWVMLGRSYVVLGQYGAAVQAWERAVALDAGRNPEILAGYGEALLLEDRSRLTGAAAPLFERVLELDPDNPRGLWYGGLAAEARGESELAARRYARLLEAGPPPNLRELVEERLAAVRAGTSSATGERPADAGSAAGLEVRIRLAGKLAGQARGTLFVFARPAGGGGPPLAVERHPADSLPLTVTLDGADAMVAGRGLQLDQPLEIVARISRSGNAQPASGDLQGRARYTPGDRPVLEIVIDSVLP